MKRSAVRSVFGSWMREEQAPAYVLGGEGARLSEMVAQGLVSRFRKEGDTVELVRWSVADLERESPGAAWRSPSFFFRWRVFVLPDAGEWKQGPRKEVLKYLESPDPSVLLVVPCSDRKARKLFTSIRGIRSASPGEEEVVDAMADFAVSLAVEEGKVLSWDAAVFLARWVGADFPRFRAELRKLISFGASRGEIGEEEIREVCVAGGAVDPFRLAEDLIYRNRKGCIEKLRRFAAAAESGDYHSLVGAIGWSVRRKLADTGRLGTGIGMRSGGAGKQFSIERGAEILSALSQIDRNLKGGSGLTPEQVFEIELLKLLS